MTLETVCTPDPSLSFGPFSSPYGDEENGCIFDTLLNSKLYGEVHTAEAIDLPQDAVLEIRLSDISEPTIPATPLAKKTIVPASQLPFKFELDYGSCNVRRGRTYSISGMVWSKGQLLYANECPHVIFAASNLSEVKIRLTALS